MFCKPLRRNLVIYQGATFRKHWIWKAGGVPVDLAGCAGRMQVRPKIESSIALLKLTTENERMVLTATGDIILRCAPAVTESLNFRKPAVYDLEIEFPDGTVCRRFYGTVTLSFEVTR
jgi:hypothetical protein